MSAREGERSGTIWTTPEGEKGVEEEEVAKKSDEDEEDGGEKGSGEERSGTMGKGALDDDPFVSSSSAFWICCVSTLFTVSSFLIVGVSEEELVIGLRWTMGERGGEEMRE